MTGKELTMYLRRLYGTRIGSTVAFSKDTGYHETSIYNWRADRTMSPPDIIELLIGTIYKRRRALDRLEEDLKRALIDVRTRPNHPDTR